jgi:hypothetical protein
MQMIYCNFFANQNGKAFFFFFFFNFYSFVLQPNKNGLDMSTSNRRPSISTSREVLHLAQMKLRFRSKIRA